MMGHSSSAGTVVLSAYTASGSPCSLVIQGAKMNTITAVATPRAAITLKEILNTLYAS